MTPDYTLEWTRLLGTEHPESGSSLTVGSDGFIYLGGMTLGWLDGNDSVGYEDVFLTKYSPNGEKVWTQQFGSGTDDSGSALTTGLDGSIYIGGLTDGALDGQKNSGGTDAFLTKYTPNGVKVWTQLLGTPEKDLGHSLATGLDGSIYMSVASWGPLNGETSGDFLTKYTPDGVKVWTQLLPNSSPSSIWGGLTIGLDGSIYASSDMNQTKYSPDGVKVWTRKLEITELLGTSGIYTSVDHALTTGLDGSIYLSGWTSKYLDPNTSQSDIFLTKYTPNGVSVWTQLLGTNRFTIDNALTTGLDGSIYLTGYTSGSLDGQTNNGNWDAFLTKYTPDGVKVWTRLLGTSGLDTGKALTTGFDGSIYMSGLTNGSLDGQTNNGGSDAFIVKYSASSSAVDADVFGMAYRIYKAAFNRTPDADGLKYWYGEMQDGMDLVEVSARFIDSSEFRSLYGTNPSNGEFLDKVYLNVLDRLPDAGGRTWWIDQLTNNPEKTWSKVLADFSESAENIGNTGSQISAYPKDGFGSNSSAKEGVWVSASGDEFSEGETVTFKIQSYAENAGDLISYALTGMDWRDFQEPLSGQVRLNSIGEAELVFHLLEDETTEGTEHLRFTADDRYLEVSVLDTSLTVEIIAPINPSPDLGDGDGGGGGGGGGF